MVDIFGVKDSEFMRVYSVIVNGQVGRWQKCYRGWFSCQKAINFICSIFVNDCDIIWQHVDIVICGRHANIDFPYIRIQITIINKFEESHREAIVIRIMPHPINILFVYVDILNFLQGFLSSDIPEIIIKYGRSKL